MNISDSDEYPVHTVVAPSEVMSARNPGVANRHDTTGSTRVVPALGAEIERPASTAEQGSQMEDYQAADWKSALHAGDTRESETDKYTLDGKLYNAQSSVNSVVSHVPPSGLDHPQIITIDFCQDTSLDPEQVGQ